MKTDQRRNEDLTRVKSIGALFVCAAELTNIYYIYVYVALTDIDLNKVHSTLPRSLVCAYALKPSLELKYVPLLHCFLLSLVITQLLCMAAISLFSLKFIFFAIFDLHIFK